MKRERLLAYALKYQGDYRSIYQAVKNREAFDQQAYQGTYLTIIDPEYPVELLDLKYPPFILFYCGDLTLLAQKKIAIVGSRVCSDYGRMITRQITDHLSHDRVIVSGMAKGIDAVAHYQAIKTGRSIGVLGCGIERIYPKDNLELFKLMKDHQLLLSEYPGLVAPHRQHFPFRNRLIAALGSCLIVTEAQIKSGTLLTVNEALELNKEVYVVPYNLGNEESGCNYLIKQGANIITEVNDLLKIDKNN